MDWMLGGKLYMTPKQKRIAIAEACGWTYVIESGPFNVLCGLFKGRTEYVPDYLNDLNAMHEAEKMLTKEQMEKFADTLDDMLPMTLDTLSYFHLIHTTAAQRAEAFLKTIGKWKNE